MEHLIAKIYEALEDEGVLKALPDLIGQELGSRSCTLQLFSSELCLEDMWVSHFDDEMANFYKDNDLHFHDAWTKINLGNFQSNKSERHSDFLALEEFCQTFFYNEFIRRFGDDSAHCLGFRATRPDGGFVLLGLQKARLDKDFTDDQIVRLEALRPHVTRMAVLRRNMLVREGMAAGALVGINSLEDAYLLVRPDRTIQFANCAAEALLEEGRLLATHSGCLTLIDRAGDEALAQALTDAFSNRIEGRLSFLACDRDGNSWRFIVAPKSFDGKKCILIWINRGRLYLSTLEALQQIYGLTRAEVSILMDFSEGLTASEIGDRHSVSVATVRTHIQHIYLKTGVNKASELAALVASLPKVKP